MIDFSDVLIVIPCLDEAANLPRLLDQFAEEAPGAFIVIADGGSVDCSIAIGTEAARQTDTVAIIENPGRIQSIGVNLAVARYSVGRTWLIRIDAHCLYPPDYVRILLDAALVHEVDSVVVPMITQGNSCFQQAAAAAQNSRLGNGGAAHRSRGEGRFVDHGHHALFRLSVFRALGGYDETFSHNEDAEFDVRLAASGGRIWLEGRAALVYFPRADPKSLFTQYFGYGVGRARTRAKHRLKLKLRQALPLAVAPACILALAASALLPLAPFAVILALPLSSWVLATALYGIVLGIRAHSRCVLAAGFAAMLMHLGWSSGFWRETTARALAGRKPQTPRF